MKPIIYVLGNPKFEQDSFPTKLLPKLQKEFPRFTFQHLDPTENLPEQERLILIDTIINTNEVRLLTEKDLDKIQSSPNYSLHDFDLGFQLKLMKKLNKIQKVTIIGIPSRGEESRLANQAIRLLKTITKNEKPKR